jgi:hypothetical protein
MLPEICCCRSNFGLPRLPGAGFDVWMANTRGNTYSRGNRHYTQLEHGFWEFRCAESTRLLLCRARVRARHKAAAAQTSCGAAAALPSA